MKTKKLMSIVLATVVLLSTLGMTACKGTPADTTSKSSDAEVKTSSDTGEAPAQTTGDKPFVVGTVTDLETNMFDGWTNGAANANIRSLTYGCSPIAYTREGKFEVDKTNTKELKQTENADGTKTFTITINNDLKWNDGTGITAKDYVFALLLHASPEFAALEASDTATYANCMVGYEDYYAGKTKSFSGIHLIDDYTFSVTIKKEELPFHFDIAYASINPNPMAVIAPKCTITEDKEKGATISADFTKELLQETIGNNETGYRYKLNVTCGPYQLSAFDASSKQATLTINPHFKGTYDGVKPSIEKIVLKKVNADTQMDELRAGTVDLISGTSGGPEIEAGLNVVDEGKAAYKAYLRAGYGKITFACDLGPTQFPAVRQAIAYCLDRESFAKQYTGGYGQLVDGYYGLSTAEYKENADEIKSSLNHYTFSVDKAKEILDKDGWNLDKDGKAYATGVRYKKVDGALMPLEINWANSPNNPVSTLLSTMLPTTMEEAGMKLIPTTVEWGVLLNNIARVDIEKPVYNMFNLATGFVPIPSYWYEFSQDEKYMGTYNDRFLKDDQLEKISADMKKIPADDQATWSKKWLELQKRFNEVLPEIPLYSDEYHDFFNTKLTNYEPDALWQWDSEIVYAKLAK